MLKKIFPLFAFLFFCNPNSFAQEQQSNSSSVLALKVELTSVDHNAFTFVPPPTILPVSERAATINVTYTGFSADAQTAFQYAVDIWETLINSTRVININATWAPAAPTNLGSAGPASVWANFTGAPISNTWYAQALAESICNCSIGSNPDITANFNSSRTDWYFGTDGNTPAGEYDFVSVVLHEIGHGLGFIGSGSVDGAGVGSLGLGDDSWAIIYDLFVENLGVSVTGYGNPSVILGNVLQGSGNLVWNGTNGVAGNGGLMPEISDPATWTGGSSYHHFDETYFPAGDMNSLMTPQLSAAEAIHHPGESGLGLLQDIGWSVNTSSGCTDPDACNFDLTAIVDDGSCTYFWYLPDVVSSGPAIQACTAPANYHLAVSQACVESVVAADSWCSNVNWDNLCQTNYECCQDEGCTDPAACNYDPDACTESGSCIYCFENCVNLTLFDSFGDGWNGASWEFLDEMGVSWANGTLSSGSEITETFCLNSGCYNFAVTSGSWPSEVSWELVGANGGVITGGAGESMSVSFGAVVGCTDPIACNYDASACSDDGSCDYYYSPPTTLLDTEWFVEYDWGCTGTPGNEVWTLNSDFTYTTPGNPGNWSLCGLSVTLLYESGTIYNGEYNIVGGYFEGTMNGSPTNCFTMSPVVDGCTDSTACNYNAYANIDDGSCNNLAPVVDITGANWLLDYDGGCDGSIADVALALFYADNTWDLPDFSNNGWWTLCGTTLELWQGAELFFIGEWSYVDFTFSGPLYDNLVEVGCGVLYLQVEGCTDPIACNYDASANTDDGSCVYPTCDDPLACNYDECSDPISVCYDAISCYEASACTYAIGWSLGCTYIDAINYDPTATVDDGSCVYDLPSLCGAGTYYDAVTSTCLPDGSGTGGGCPGDLDNDGFINTSDLLAFLSVFGSACP